MPERDWQKDWELCQKAPGGLWSRVKALGWDYWTVGVIEDHQARPFCDEEAERAWDFIEATREGWPVALAERTRLAERVKELEEEIAVMKNALEFYAYTKPVCECIVDGVYTKYKDHGEIARQALTVLEKGVKQNG